MEENKNQAVLTVTQLNEYVKFLIDNNPTLKNVTVKGEISNFTNHYRTGHLYFTLKDDGGVLKAIMFKSSAEKLKFMPENGMKVIIHGRVSAFVRDGAYQLYATSLEPDGVGALYIAYEQLKRKLESEGLFDPSKKRQLPKSPMRVGIITSPTGAAVRDMINIMGRRFPAAKLILYPAQVQGDEAAPQLVEAVNYFSQTHSVDVVIIGRGGGSIEDLWAFNDERLARAVSSCSVPIISAVGHETDFTICDFVADRRAPTPSAAAELAVPDRNELKRKLGNVVTYMTGLLGKSIESRREKISYLAHSRALTAPNTLIDDKRMLLASDESKLYSAMKLNAGDKRARFGTCVAKLEALNPLAIIARGYSVVFTPEGHVISSVKQVKAGDTVCFKTSDGEVEGTVNKILENENVKNS